MALSPAVCSGAKIISRKICFAVRQRRLLCNASLFENSIQRVLVQVAK